MSTRLLSLLSNIEKAIIGIGGSSEAKSRTVNYNKGLARALLNDGGAWQVQNFLLADGQVCVKVALYWPNCRTPYVESLYPTPTFNWRLGIDRIAETWMGGPEAVGISPSMDADGNSALAGLAATG